MSIILAAAVAYLLGCVSAGPLVLRLLPERSWNHLAAHLADALKGAAAVALLTPAGPWSPAVTATAVVAGHLWPVTGRQEAGLGLAVAAGALSMISPVSPFVWALLWAITFVATGFQPVACAVATIFFAPLMGYIAGWPLGAMALPVCVMIMDRLRPSLRRVLLGTEPRHVWRAGS